MSYKAAVSTSSAANGGVGYTESILINRALELLSKVLPWVAEKYMSAEAHDFFPVSLNTHYVNGLWSLDHTSPVWEIVCSVIAVLHQQESDDMPCVFVAWCRRLLS